MIGRYELPTVPCLFCGAPTTYTGTKHCDPCHNIDRESTERILRVLAQRDDLPLLFAHSRPYYPHLEFPGTMAEAKATLDETVAECDPDGAKKMEAVIGIVLERVDLKSHY